MLSWFFEKRIDAFERSYAYDMSYTREILKLSPGALMKFMRATEIGKFRQGVSLEAWYAAGLVAIVAEDCGPCTQLGVTMAERAGVDPSLITNVIAGRFDNLPEPVADTARFTLATMQRSPEADELRQRVERHFGRIGVLSIAFRIVAARIYPTVKYALGYGKACQRITVAGRCVTPDASLKLIEQRVEPTSSHARAV
ncbi:MAG TPA: hypothetical protein VIV60_15060 [Polyangiaceae bacterium]